MKNENGAGVNLNLNEYQFNIYSYIHGSTIFFHPCRDAFCAIEIITTIIKLLNNLLIVRERIIIG